MASFTLWCNVASGRSTFALGVALGLGACLLLMRPKPTWGVLTGAATVSVLATMASPMAGPFLLVAAAAWLLVGELSKAAALGAPPIVVIALTTTLFPFSGEQPMQAWDLWGPLIFSVLLVMAGPIQWRALKAGAGVYAAGAVLAYLIPTPVGSNVIRLAELFAAPVLLAALLAPGLQALRRLTLAGALVLSLAWVTEHTVQMLRTSTPVPAWATETRGVVSALDRLEADRVRVEAVPADNHREITALASHVNLARGWTRQFDVKRGRLFYDGSFSATAYRAWLDKWAVGFVVLASGTPDDYAEDEAKLVATKPNWLELEWKDKHWKVFRVRNAVPMVSAPASVVQSTSTDMVVRVPERGSVTVRIAYSPWLRAEGACLKRHGEFTQLTVETPGTYRISSGYGRSSGPSAC
ncbi:hypothetical protein [Streptomyces lasiicapitis]|uniref:hypothetical protein n=1 Tax=Streptomyces lasiicapitis TaxID=1923961 RepID=UPI00365D8A5B